MLAIVKNLVAGVALLIGVLVGLDFGPDALVRWEQLTVGVAAVAAIVLITRAMTKTMVELRAQSSEQMHEMLEVMTRSQDSLAESLRLVAEQLAKLGVNVQRIEEDISVVGKDLANIRYEQERHQYTYKHDRSLVDE